MKTADTTYHFFAYVDDAGKGECGNSSLDWMYALPAGHRIFASAFAAAGSIYFGTSTSETEDPCEGAGNPDSNKGKLFVMNIKQTGTPTPKFTKETGNILSAPLVDDENLVIKPVGYVPSDLGKPPGVMMTSGPYNNPLPGDPLPSIASWREIFGKDESLVPAP